MKIIDDMVYLDEIDEYVTIKEYKDYENRWYELYEDEELPLSVYEDDPINKIEKVI